MVVPGKIPIYLDDQNRGSPMTSESSRWNFMEEWLSQGWKICGFQGPRENQPCLGDKNHVLTPFQRQMITLVLQVNVTAFLLGFSAWEIRGFTSKNWSIRWANHGQICIKRLHGESKGENLPLLDWWTIPICINIPSANHGAGMNWHLHLTPKNHPVL